MGRQWEGADLFAAGVPCPPFSVAGKQLGADDDRDMFPSALKLIAEIHPRAVLLENVPGFCIRQVHRLSQEPACVAGKARVRGRLANTRSSRFRCGATTPTFFAGSHEAGAHAPFSSGRSLLTRRKTVGETLLDLMLANGWKGAKAWAKKAAAIAPNCCGRNQKNMVGQTSARRALKHVGEICTLMERALPQMLLLKTHHSISCRALLFAWSPAFRVFQTHGNSMEKKTASYRQVGNAFPPLVAKAVGDAIRAALNQQVYPVCEIWRGRPAPTA